MAQYVPDAKTVTPEQRFEVWDQKLDESTSVEDIKQAEVKVVEFCKEGKFTEDQCQILKEKIKDRINQLEWIEPTTPSPAEEVSEITKVYTDSQRATPRQKVYVREVAMRNKVDPDTLADEFGARTVEELSKTQATKLLDKYLK